MPIHYAALTVVGDFIVTAAVKVSRDATMVSYQCCIWRCVGHAPVTVLIVCLIAICTMFHVQSHIICNKTTVVERVPTYPYRNIPLVTYREVLINPYSKFVLNVNNIIM